MLRFSDISIARLVKLDKDFCFLSIIVIIDRSASNYIKNTHFGALKVKDGVVDFFRDHEGVRPSVDPKRPDLRVVAQLAKGRLILSLDLSGDSLHRRGYRLEGGEAPLKENIAAAVLLRAGWPQIAQQGGSLIDPMCGSGTLLLDAVASGMGPQERCTGAILRACQRGAEQHRLRLALDPEPTDRLRPGLHRLASTLLGVVQNHP